MAAFSQDSPSLARRWDAIVLGGGLAGAACALHVVRSVPGASVLVLSRAAQPDATMLTVRGAGARFLLGELGLEEERELWTLPHHGTRHWWADESDARLEAMLECGEYGPPREPAFHVDEAALTRCLTRRAEGLGARFEVARELREVDLDLPLSRLEVQLKSGTQELQTAWILDASGALARPTRSTELELHVAGGRWSGLRAWSQFPDLPRRPGLRSLSEHQFHGLGWRAQLSPAPGDRHWLQVALDPACNPTLAEEHRGLATLQDYGGFVRSRPGLRELLRGGRLESEGFSAELLAARYPEPACGRGWVSVGESAGRLAPFDGEPLEQLARNARVAATLVEHGLPSRPASRAHEGAQALAEAFRQRAARWGEDSLLLGGDPTLLTAATSLDLALGLAPIQSVQSEALRAWIRARLICLAHRLETRGLRGLPPAWGVRGAPSSSLFQLLRGTSAWLRLEGRCLRDHFTPVSGDEHQSVTQTLQQYTGSRPVR